MSSDDKFWVAQFAILAVIILGIAGYTTSYHKAYDERIAELVEAGTDPLAAMCALEDQQGNNPTCVLLSAKR